MLFRFCYKRRRRKAGKRRKKKKKSAESARAEDESDGGEIETTFASIFRDRSKAKHDKAKKRWVSEAEADEVSLATATAGRDTEVGAGAARKKRGARPRGTLYCPNEHCRKRIGRWDWDGLECSCGEHMQPGFAVSCR